MKKCDYCCTKIDSNATICPQCGSGKKYGWRSPIWLVIASYLAVVVATVCTMYTIDINNTISKRTEDIVVMIIESEFRGRFREWRNQVSSNGISTGRDTILQEGTAAYKLLYNYWDAISYDEYVAFNNGGDGVIKEQYKKFYEPLLKNAIKDKPVLRRFLEIYLRNAEQEGNVFNDFKEEYNGYLKSLYEEYTNELKERQKNEFNSKQNAKTELDVFFTYLSYAIVYADWQNKEDDTSRGYNIGSILVDSCNNVAAWSVNRIKKMKNKTQHAEASLIYNYLDSAPTASLKNFSLYTTLEPCAMCAGMIVMTDVKNVVYGQADPEYGQVFDKLHQHHAYPKSPHVIKSHDVISNSLDSLYTLSLKKDNNHHITKFLTTANAKDIFKQAKDSVEQFKCFYKENESIINNAKIYINQK
jgi:tRNA(Arg) A34 adenosine deaminase TadA